MRCREGKHLVCPKLGVKGREGAGLGATWDLFKGEARATDLLSQAD